MNEHVLRIVGTFDSLAAARLCEQLGLLPPGASVVLDFTGSRHVSIPALGVLVNALLFGSALRVRQRGLARHEARLLGYCGIPPFAPGQG